MMHYHSLYAEARQAEEHLESAMDAFIPEGRTVGFVRWQMHIKPEDLNRGFNLVLANNKAFSCRKERCGNSRDVLAALSGLFSDRMSSDSQSKSSCTACTLAL